MIWHCMKKGRGKGLVGVKKVWEKFWSGAKKSEKFGPFPRLFFPR